MSRKESAIILVQQAINEAMKTHAVIEYTEDRKRACVYVEFTGQRFCEQEMNSDNILVLDTGSWDYSNSRRVSNILEKYKIASSKLVSVQFGSLGSYICNNRGQGKYYITLGSMRMVEIPEDDYCEILEYALSCNTQPVQQMFFMKN